MIALGAMLLVSALAKAISPRDTLVAMGVIGRLVAAPTAWDQWAAQSLLLVEIALASVLLTGVMPRAASIAVCVLMTGFFTWQIAVVSGIVSAPCGCGLTIPHLSADQQKWASFSKTTLMFIAACALVCATNMPRITHHSQGVSR